MDNKDNVASLQEKISAVKAQIAGEKVKKQAILQTIVPIDEEIKKLELSIKEMTTKIELDKFEKSLVTEEKKKAEGIIEDGYKKFLITKYGSYEKFLGHDIIEFYEWLYGQKFTDAIATFDFFQMPTDDGSCSESSGLTCFEEYCYCRQRCSICGDGISQGGGGGYYQTMDYDMCDVKCRNKLIMYFKQKGIIIMKKYIAYPAYGD